MDASCLIPSHRDQVLSHRDQQAPLQPTLATFEGTQVAVPGLYDTTSERVRRDTPARNVRSRECNHSDTSFEH